MKRKTRLILLLLFGVLAALQLFQPERNQGAVAQDSDLVHAASLPDSLSAILVNSCYDCHSNHTKYPWYSIISPVSWVLNRHIRDGKEELNLSEFGNLREAEKIGVLSDIYDVLEAGSMPLKSYLLLHGDARMNQEEIVALKGWADQESLSLMRK